MHLKAIAVGNSDGIGLAATKRLLNAGWDITGVSRSESQITSPTYHHRVADVSDRTYPELLDELLLRGPFDLCIYFVGIGDLFDPSDMSKEPEVIDVNLTGMVKTAAGGIPQMVRSHFKTSPRAQIRRWGEASNPQNTMCIPAVGHLAPP